MSSRGEVWGGRSSRGELFRTNHNPRCPSTLLCCSGQREELKRLLVKEWSPDGEVGQVSFKFGFFFLMIQHYFYFGKKLIFPRSTLPMTIIVKWSSCLLGGRRETSSIVRKHLLILLFLSKVHHNRYQSCVIRSQYITGGSNYPCYCPYASSRCLAALKVCKGEFSGEYLEVQNILDTVLLIRAFCKVTLEYKNLPDTGPNSPLVSPCHQTRRRSVQGSNFSLDSPGYPELLPVAKHFWAEEAHSVMNRKS